MRSALLRSLLRNKLTVIVLVSEIALAFAIIANTTLIVRERYKLLNISTGLAEKQLIVAEIAKANGSEMSQDEVRSDLEAIRAIPGVQAVGMVNVIPMGGNEWTVNLSTQFDGERQSVPVSEYVVSKGALKALGINIIAGRIFRADEYPEFTKVLPPTSSAIITVFLARRLFPNESALGKRVYVGGQGMTIIGIAKALTRATATMGESAQNSLILPAQPRGDLSRFTLIRTSARPENTIAQLRALVPHINPNVYVSNANSYSDLKASYQAHDQYLFWIMAIASLLATGVVAFGIFALSSLWIRQRRKSMAIRRMLGATQRDILIYVLSENVLISFLGCGVGTFLAYLMNGIGISVYGMGVLTFPHVLVCTVLVIVLGLLATYRLGSKAAKLDPAITLRQAAS